MSRNCIPVICYLSRASEKINDAAKINEKFIGGNMEYLTQLLNKLINFIEVFERQMKGRITYDERLGRKISEDTYALYGLYTKYREKISKFAEINWEFRQDFDHGFLPNRNYHDSKNYKKFLETGESLFEEMKSEPNLSTFSDSATGIQAQIKLMVPVFKK